MSGHLLRPEYIEEEILERDKIDLDNFGSPTSYQIFLSIRRMRCAKMCAPTILCITIGLLRHCPKRHSPKIASPICRGLFCKAECSKQSAQEYIASQTPHSKMHHPLVKRLLRIAIKSLACVASVAWFFRAWLPLAGVVHFSPTGLLLALLKNEMGHSNGQPTGTQCCYIERAKLPHVCAPSLKEKGGIHLEATKKYQQPSRGHPGISTTIQSPLLRPH